jgi:hypothetical protein
MNAGWPSKKLEKSGNTRHDAVTDKPVLLNSKHEPLDIDDLIETCRADPNRVLADDEIGFVAYVGDMEIFSVSGLGHPVTGDPSPGQAGHWVQKVLEISVLRFGESTRRQIGSVVKTVAADSIFVVRDDNALRKVKARDLKAGMVLHTGEKVYW